MAQKRRDRDLSPSYDGTVAEKDLEKPHRRTRRVIDDPDTSDDPDLKKSSDVEIARTLVALAEELMEK